MAAPVNGSNGNIVDIETGPACERHRTAREDIDVRLDAAQEVYAHKHYSHRAPLIRASVLGASDGLVSVGALVTGIGAAQATQHQLILSAVAASVAGALSMAVGEYVSVAQQADTERADVEKERQAQAAGPAARAAELTELTQIYISRGLDAALAAEVARQLTDRDVIRAHARDELGIDIDSYVSPLQAAASSAGSFVSGSLIPSVMLLLPTHAARLWGVIGAVSIALTAAGALSAHLGGASLAHGAGRLLCGGLLAMGITYGVGHAIGVDA